MAFYQLSPTDMMVVLDDLALPCGKLRLRAGGSSGGHNGLKDIERALGTSEYPRLRLGIDAAAAAGAGKDYVLGRFSDGAAKADRPGDRPRGERDPGLDRKRNRDGDEPVQRR